MKKINTKFSEVRRCILYVDMLKILYHMQTYVQPLCPFAVPNLWGASELNMTTVSLEAVQRAPVLKMVVDGNMRVRCDVLSGIR